MKRLAIALISLMLALALAGCSGGADSKKRTEELRSAIEALDPAGATVSPIHIGHCFSEAGSDPPSCGIVNYFFPEDYDYVARRDRLRVPLEREGWEFVATTEVPGRLFAGFYYKREGFYLHLLVIDDERRERCTDLGPDTSGRYQPRECFDMISIYDHAPLGLNLAQQ